MKAVIYQFWEGNMTPGNQAGVDLMREYAEAIGVEYKFELNPSWPADCRIQRKNIGQYQPHYGAFKPLFDKEFDNYDYILFCDTDIIPLTHSRSKPRKNIFAEFMGRRQVQATSGGAPVDLWISEEWMQPALRSKHNMGGINNKNDVRWSQLMKTQYGADIPVDDIKRPRVFNSGVVMYSAKARLDAQKYFPDFAEYCNFCRQSSLPAFYQGDQNYLNAMMTAHLNWEIMPYIWNSQMFYRPETSGENRPTSDYREDNTQFVHLQQRGADHWDKEKIIRTAND